MVWRIDDPQGHEAAKVRFDIVPYTKGTVLDLGCGPSKAWPHFIGVDSCKDTRIFGIQMRPDVVVDTCERLTLIADESCDAVFSSHLLEHIDDYEEALAEWWRVVKPGGHLCLYLPDKRLYPNIGQHGANPDHKHDFLPSDITDAMCRIGASWSQIENESRDQGQEYSFLQVYRKTANGRHECIQCVTGKRPGRRACVVRYGGFGDMIQSASVLPQLKEQGYEVHVMTTPKGQDVLRHDPHIDHFVIQGEGQIDNAELGAYWTHWARKYDRFVNLSESVEGTFLPNPTKMVYHWPDEARRRHCGRNYLEATAHIAGVEFHPENACFYASKDEDDWAMAQLRQGAFNLLWVLSGSSVHKVWPYLDQAVARLLIDYRDIHIILSGEDACQILEAGWEKEPRVTRVSGKWSIRESLAVSQHVQCVVGPETGILNAVAFVPAVAKVLMLSHSSAENLCRDWLNTKALAANVPCYPCHRLHYDRTFCPEKKVPVIEQPWYQDGETVKAMRKAGHIDDEGLYSTGASVCAAGISVEAVVKGIGDAYESWRTHQPVSHPG